jgi:glycosyltransferase involved in cell wall biosynthesis
LANALSDSIQVLIAAYNEEQGIGRTIKEIQEYINAPVLVVDGKSKDRTVEVAEDLGAEIVIQKTIGKGAAIAEGIAHLNPSAKYVVITDADYTYPAESIPQMIKILDANPKIGMVCGNRFHKRGSNPLFGSSSVFGFGNKLIAFTHNVLNGVTLEDPLTGLRVVRGNLLRNWDVQSQGFDIEVELNYYIEQMDYEIVEVPIIYRSRLGEKKLKPKDGAAILKRVIIGAVTTNLIILLISSQT